MGKNKNKETPDPNSISNRDIIQRLNFLYQASVFLSSVSPHAPHLPGSPPGEAQNGLNPRHSRRQKRTITTSELSKRYIDTMKIVGQKTNVRIDPSLKRHLCKSCLAVLIPGVSATIRVKDSRSHGHLVSSICLACQTERRIPAPPLLSIDRMASAPSENANSDARDSGKPEQRHQRRGRRKKKALISRPLPFFARDAGHVVFRGNEVISDSSRHTVTA